MPKYVLEFEKKGLVKYTSHLDMLRLFKRAFKTSGIPLEYSQGYNPHPKMGFAQPLSLGFTSSSELLEFTTSDSLRCEIVLGNLKDRMPIGINLLSLKEADPKRNLASLVTSAKYRAVLPLDYASREHDIRESLKGYLDQPEILAKKREKKTKNFIDKDIKNLIRSIEIEKFEGKIAFVMEVDAGSKSNLNPELVIQTFALYAGIMLEKGDFDIERISLEFSE
ncbi:MAG: DUF2344 domain-containing protein [Firmicutes bacterium]|nr:DUF2344 domain-containing protein [Bacillota bacterium]